MNSPSNNADCFALLDAGTDDAGRLYMSGDGVTAMLRGMAEQWQKEARKRGELDARTLLALSDRLTEQADQEGATHSPWRPLHLSESGRRSSRSRTNRRVRCHVVPTATSAITTVPTRRRPPGRGAPSTPATGPPHRRPLGNGELVGLGLRPSARPTVTSVGRAAGPA